MYNIGKHFSIIIAAVTRPLNDCTPVHLRCIIFTHQQKKNGVHKAAPNIVPAATPHIIPFPR